MQHHPDRGGDQNVFQEIQAAYEVLGDPQRRAQYDQPQPQTHFNMNFGGGDINDIFNMFRQQGFGDPFFNQTQRRGHARITLWISLHDVATGGKRTVSLGNANGVSAVEIDIPQGINDGDHVQYPKLGPGGVDLVVTYRIQPNTTWQRQGLDLVTTHRVVIWDLILGSIRTVKDVYDVDLTVRVPAGTQPGTRLRLRGRGLRDKHGNQGDLYVQLETYLPENIPDAIVAAIREHGGQ